MTVFAALSDETRVGLLELLRDGEKSVGDLVGAFHLTQPAISQHLRVLKEAGLVSSRAQAQRRVYRIEPGPLREMDAWLSRYRKFWAEELDALAAHLDEHPE